MRVCCDCKEKKQLSAFSKERDKKLGRAYRCRECDRLYRGTSERLEYQKKYRQKNKKRARKHWKVWVSKNRNKVKAVQKLNYAIRIGKLKRGKCFCGDKKTQGHHHNYSKPLEVEWLCELHHNHKHIQISSAGV